MSLDVYLYQDACEHCGRGDDHIYSANITHNLGGMAGAAGIYLHLWHPEELKITRAEQLIEPLRSGLLKMKLAATHFAKYDSPNGWGTYADFVPWIERYLKACEENPKAKVRTST